MVCNYSHINLLSYGYRVGKELDLGLGFFHASMKEEQRGKRVVYMQGSDYSDEP